MLATLAVLVHRRWLTPTPGLEARVFATRDWTGPSAAAVRDDLLDPARLARASGLDPRGAFSVEWRGWLAVGEAGTYWFKLVADDAAALWIDDAMVVDSRGPHTPDWTRGGSATLGRGMHAIVLRYAQHGGDERLRLSWATPSYREDWRGMPLFQPASNALAPTGLASTGLTSTGPSLRAASWRHDAPLLLAGAWSAWMALTLMALLAVTADRCCGVLRPLNEAPRALGVVLVGGTILVLGSITWGLPPWRPWGLDEIMPSDVLTAMGQRFSGGWHDIYPPLHFMWLSIAYVPTLVVERAGWLASDDPTVTSLLHLVGRGVTALVGVATLCLVYLCGVEGGARRGAAVWSAAALAVTLPFVYYAKTTNVDVPYVFWATASFLFFLRALRTCATVDCCGLAMAAACAVCTKDQAYGFYPGMAIALATVALWRPRIDIGHLRALALGGLLFVVVFVAAQNLVFNLDGFLAHLRRITTTAGPETYRMFPATASGMVSLAGATLALIPWCLGWGVTFAAVAGVVILLRAPHPNPLPASGERVGVRGVSLLWLAAPVVSYLVTFVAAVGYVYDRFLLGILVVCALWAGVALDRVASWRWSQRRVGAALAASVLVITMLYAVSVNVAMARDSRLDAESWLRANGHGDPVVVGIGGQEYLPNLHPWRFRLTSTRASEALAWSADFIIVNEPRARRLAAAHGEPAALDRLERGDAGYTRVFRARTALPWFALLRYSGWWQSADDESFTNLDKIGPTISIWQRAPSPTH